MHLSSCRTDGLLLSDAAARTRHTDSQLFQCKVRLAAAPPTTSSKNVVQIKSGFRACSGQKVIPGWRPVDRSPCVRSVQLYSRRYLQCAVQLPALYTVHRPHTRSSYVVPGGDVFEFIINCMSLLNIAHARHGPHHSRWLLWPGALVISTKTARTGDAGPILVSLRLSVQNTKAGMTVYLATVVAVFFCVVGNVYLWCKHGTIRVTAARARHRQTWQNTAELSRTSLRSLVTRLSIIKFSLLIPKYLGSDHSKDSCEVPRSAYSFK